MKTFCLIAFCVFVANVYAKLPPSERVHGENGWYVPQMDNSMEWLDVDEALEELHEAEIEPYALSKFTPAHFFLYTAKNPTVPEQIYPTEESIANSNFNPKNPTRFVIHGWRRSASASINTKIRDAWLGHGDHNIICVDWPRARFEYVSSVAAIPRTGRRVAQMIDFLVEKFGMSLNTLTLAGHSLGAHVAGHAGKNVKTGKIHTIWGLDPALPLFRYRSTGKRLDESDATYVETIHTNGGFLGFLKPIGKGSFYPNGGVKQFNCEGEYFGTCSHYRAVEYYVEAIKQNSFTTYLCDDYQKAVSKQCGNGSKATRMGQLENVKSFKGVYYVPTNKESPFGRPF